MMHEVAHKGSVPRIRKHVLSNLDIVAVIHGHIDDNHTWGL